MFWGASWRLKGIGGISVSEYLKKLSDLEIERNMQRFALRKSVSRGLQEKVLQVLADEHERRERKKAA